MAVSDNVTGDTLEHSGLRVFVRRLWMLVVCRDARIVFGDETQEAALDSAGIPEGMV